jgi:uncharacterized membrane protein YbhN (UPF0104 family)
MPPSGIAASPAGAVTTNTLSKWAPPLLAAAIVGLGAYSLSHILRGLHFHDIYRAVGATSAARLWSCMALTGVSFIALGGYDSLAAGIVAPRRVSPLRAWLAGAIANAVSNTLGFHALTAAAVRYRLLARSGLSKAEIAGVTALSWTALAFGFAAMFCLASMLSPAASPGQRLGGAALFGLLLLWVRWLGPGRELAFKGRAIRLPPGRIALAQMGLGTVEMAAAIGGLYVLMPPDAVPTFAAFSILYIGAVLLGIASHLPGGIGVFEATILGLSQGPDRAAIVAALLIYRAIYNLLPFLVAVLALGGEELRARLSSKADSAG